MPFRKKNNMDKIGNFLGKYFVPGLLAFLGLILLIFSGGQTTGFKLGSIAILVVGVLGTLYVKGTIPAKAQIFVGIFVTAGALLFVYLDYDVIKSRLIYERKVERVEKHVVQRLKDIRKAQIAYNREHGKYTDNFDSLLHFLKEGELTLIKRLGSLPDSIATEEEARELGLIQKMPEGMTEAQVIAEGTIVRDTVQADVLSYVFNESDRKTRKTKLYVDSLPFVPFASHRFEMATAQIDAGGVEQNVFQVIDPKPFAKQFKVGSLTEASTSGNWTR